MKMKIILSIITILFISITVKAQHMDMMMSDRPDAHAPICIMQDHCHGKGQWMFAYRYMPMWMSGNLSGSKNIGNSEIFTKYGHAAQSMTMQMHMVDVMYGLSNHVTLMVMGNYYDKKMNSLMDMSGMGMPDMPFSTKSNGFGDISLSGLIRLVDKHRQMVHAIVGVSIPAGSISKQAPADNMMKGTLDYPMQMGSGTWDPLLGAAYMGQSDMFTWGAQAKYNFRFGKNHADYRLGNEFNSDVWFAVKANKYVSFSGSLQYINSDKIVGADNSITEPMMMPSTDPQNSGQDLLNAGIGCNFYVPKGMFKNLRFGVAYELPIYRHVTGIQMKTTNTLSVGIQYVIGDLGM